MSEVLYRKYRPSNFGEVMGQDHIVSVIEKSIKNKKVAHAYLFSGSRGIGKTSIARILAKDLGTHSDDIYEIDAASNRGIDDIRAIRDAVNTLPFHSTYKVYIVDEVHMLTKEAFNALLKTLEEPPAYVIFMLATTELEKIPETIISRCEVYRFKKPTVEVLSAQVQNVAKQEGFTISKASAELVALLGDGSFRDTLGALQKVIGMSKDKKLDDEEVRNALGAPSKTLIHDFVDCLATKNIDGALSTIEKVKQLNLSISTYLELVLRTLRFALLVRYAKSMHEGIKADVGDDEFEYLLEKSKDVKSGISSATISEFLKAREEMNISALPELPLELAVIRVLGEK
jgi:DNA polymerase-3 subunit gamma/tau